MATTPRHRIRGRGIVGPLIIIALGVALLLTNFGYIAPDLWRTLANFWPLLLVLAGIELLLTGRASWGPLILAIIVLLIIGAVVGHAGFGPRFGQPGPGFGSPRTFTTALEGAQSAEINIQHGAGQLSITTGTAAGQLVEGTASGGYPSSVSTRYAQQNGVGRLDITGRTRGGIGDLFGGSGASDDLTMRITRAIPIRRLQVQTGVSSATLDLTGLQLQDLDLQAGGSQVDLTLPQSGVITATVNAGASSLTITIPQGMAARIEAEGGVANLQIDQSRFPSTGPSAGIPGLATRAQYQSASYDTAQNRVDLHLQAGAASITVR